MRARSTEASVCPARTSTPPWRAQREDVAGAGEVRRLGRRIDGGEDGDGAVGSADAGSDADARVDGLGKSGAVGGSVDGRHEREVQLVAAVFGEGHADQTAAVLGHEVDRKSVV